MGHIPTKAASHFDIRFRSKLTLEFTTTSIVARKRTDLRAPCAAKLIPVPPGTARPVRNSDTPMQTKAAGAPS
jgi:hypothetical protein